MSSLLDVIILKNAGGRACGSKNYAFLSQGYTHDEFQQQNSGGKLPTTLAVATIGNYDASEYSNPFPIPGNRKGGSSAPSLATFLFWVPLVVRGGEWNFCMEGIGRELVRKHTNYG